MSIKRYVSYYYVGGAMLGTLRRVRERIGTNTYDAWVRFGYIVDRSQTNEDLRDKMVRSTLRALTPKPVPYFSGFQNIFLALNMQDAGPGKNDLPRLKDSDPSEVRKNLKAHRDHWDKVVMVEAADEQIWDRDQTKAHLAVVRGQMNSLLLSQKPLGLTYSPEQVRSPAIGDPLTLAPPSVGGPGPDWIGISAFNDRFVKRFGLIRPWDLGIDANMAYIEETFDLAIARMHSEMDICVVFPSFDRNSWFQQMDRLIHEDSLAEMNRRIWEFISAAPWFHRVRYIRFFNWGRISLDPKTGKEIGWGTRHYGNLQKVHRQIIEELRARGEFA